MEVASGGTVKGAILVDGGGMLHSFQWPKGLVEDLVKGIEQYMTKTVVSLNGYIIFDQYFDYSIKYKTRLKTIGLYNRSLSIKTALSAKEICMSSTTEKENLIQIIAGGVVGTVHSKESSFINWLLLQRIQCPVKKRKGISKNRGDLDSMFDQVDYLLPQVDSAVKDGKISIKVISSDTDVFVFLCSMYLSQGWWDAKVYMQAFNDEKNPSVSE